MCRCKQAQQNPFAGQLESVVPRTPKVSAESSKTSLMYKSIKWQQLEFRVIPTVQSAELAAAKRNLPRVSTKKYWLAAQDPVGSRPNDHR